MQENTCRSFGDTGEACRKGRPGLHLMVRDDGSSVAALVEILLASEAHEVRLFSTERLENIRSFAQTLDTREQRATIPAWGFLSAPAWEIQASVYYSANRENHPRNHPYSDAIESGNHKPADLMRLMLPAPCVETSER